MNSDLKNPAVLIGILIVLSILFSFILVPKGVELGYLHLKNNELVLATDEFDRLYAQGDRSATTISSLIQLSLSRSNPDKAIFYLKGYLERNPNDNSALRKLMELYREAMRPDDYIKTLALLQEREPSLDQARELEEIYRFSGPDDVHAEAMKKLIGTAGEMPEDYEMLAQYDAATGHLDEALDVLDKGGTLLRNAFIVPAAALQVTILLDQSRDSQAFQAAKSWAEVAARQARPDVSLVAGMAQDFYDHGLIEYASRIVEPMALSPSADPSLAVFYVSTLIDLHRSQEAVRYLSTQNGGQIDLSLMPAYVQLDVSQGNVQKAFDQAALEPFANLPNYVVAELAKAALEAERPDLLARLQNRLTDSFFRDFPLIGGFYYLSLHNDDEARKWLGLAEVRNTAELTDLAELELRLGEREKVYDRLQAMSAFEANDDFIYQIANVLIQQGYAAEALPRFEQMRQGHPDVDPGWALIAAAANGPGVTDWLAGRPDPALSAEFLENLSDAATLGKNRQTMLATALRWNKIAPSNNSKLALLEAYTANDDFQSAMALLPTIDPKAVDLADFYERAVQPAMKAGGPLLRAVSDYWMQRLKDSKTPADTEQAVGALSDLGQSSAILPQTKALAQAQPATWGPVYTGILEKLGRRDELVAYQTSRIRDPTLKNDDRRSMAYGLLDLGAKPAAEQAFEINLETETARSPDLDELLYLWGPRPSAEERDWLARRAGRAKGADRKAWLEALQGRATESDLAANTGEASEPPQSQADRLAEAAQIASDKGDLAAAHASYALAAVIEPRNPVRLRDLAEIEFQQKHYDDAAIHFGQYFAAGGDDAQSDFTFGNLLQRQNRKAEALPYFQRSLDRIDAQARPSLQDESTKAELLQRLGRTDEARQQYEALLKAHPKDTSLRADYAEMLIETGDVEAASQLVAGP